MRSTRLSVIAALALLLAFTLQVNRAEARRGYKSALQQRFESIQQMQAGAEKQQALEQLIIDDRKQKLGAAPTEELVRLVLDRDSEADLTALAEELLKRKSTDYELKRRLAEAVYRKENNLKTSSKLLDSALRDLLKQRRKPPHGTYRQLYISETSRIEGRINNQYGRMLLDAGDIEGANRYALAAVTQRGNPEDLKLFGEILFKQGSYRESMGALMASLVRGDLKDVAPLFRSAYDSLGWDATHYNKYFDAFKDLYLRHDVDYILKQKTTGRLKEHPALTLTELIDEKGGVLVLWDDALTDPQLRALQEIYTALQSQGIVYQILYVGDNGLRAEERIQKLGLSLPTAPAGDADLLRMCHVTKLPTVLIIGPNRKFLFRIDGGDRSLPQVFRGVWDHYTSSPGEPAGRESAG